MANKGREQCLVRHRRRERGKSVLEVDKDALGQVMAISKKLYVISIIGPTRSGKSYLLDRLFTGKNPGFKVGHKIEPKTQGIWMLILDHPEKEDYQLLILDIEGYGKSCAVDTYMEEMIQAIAFGVSSTIIANEQRIIGESEVEKLALFTEIAKHIVPNERSDESDGPLLVYVVHNFTLKRECSDDDYLRNTLKVDNKEDMNSKRAAVRLAIDGFFSNRKTFLLHSPVRDCRNLEKLTDLNDEELSSSFKQKISDIRDLLMTLSSPLSITAQEWCTLLKRCVEKANSRTIPESTSPYEVLRADFAKGAKRARHDPVAWSEHQGNNDAMQEITGNANNRNEAEVQQIVEYLQRELRRLGPEQFAATSFSRNWFATAVFGESGGRMSFSDESVTLDVARGAVETHSVIYCQRATFSGLRQRDAVFYSIPLSCGPEDIVLSRPVQLKFRHFADIGDIRQVELLVVYTRSGAESSFRHDGTAQVEIEDKWAIVRMMKLCDVVVAAKLPE
ncbi:guanylate-binding protein 5-like isoform X2 [Lineus longissimus]|uniref:guanylate-binding protein 5-like isoform X2 n=1 Tax=Lineus longissimus TaxID=88925 RepID=UPI00315D9CC2